MGGLRCDYCGKDWVQSCWTADEAANCGNMDAQSIRRAKDAAKAVAAVERKRKGPTKAQVEAAERRELARLKAKYE